MGNLYRKTHQNSRSLKCSAGYSRSPECINDHFKNLHCRLVIISSRVTSVLPDPFLPELLATALVPYLDNCRLYIAVPLKCIIPKILQLILSILQTNHVNL